MRDTDADVIVGGQGVVGLLTSIYLAQRGHRVIAIERQARPYSLPRAVHYDPDVNRLLAGLGISRDDQSKFSEPAESYDWLTADRQLLLTFPSPIEGDQGWPGSTMFAQPDLEEALRGRQAELPNLDVRWDTSLEDLEHDAEGVTAIVTGGLRLRASFLVGCDGANSTVREAMGFEVDDLDFSSDWLVMDLKMPPREWVPVNGQICDPARPTSCVSGGPGRRRFEFMLMAGDDRAAFATETNAWKLVEPWGVDPSAAELERLAVYTFRAQCAKRWQDGRVFIAGDAAHQMPPFWGRGMVSGARDALNLSWKLDHVLRGAAPATLLDSYQSERFVHVQFAMGMSIELGRVICETDPDAVAARDAHFLKEGPLPWNALPPMPPEVLGPGYFPGGAPGSDPVAGRIGVQGRLHGADGATVLPDVFTFGEFSVFIDGRSVTSDDADRIRASVPGAITAKVIRVVPEGGEIDDRHTGRDVDGRYRALFDDTGMVAVVYRPDFHGFGSASTVDGAITLVEALLV